MHGKAFFDTNVLLYAIAEDVSRSRRAEELLAGGGMISVQVLNEFVSVVRRKMRMPWKDIKEALQAIRILCPEAASLTINTHEEALRIAEEYGCGVCDALIAAAALEGSCVTLYSEDFQDGQIIDRKLTVRNPFRLAGSV